VPEAIDLVKVQLDGTATLLGTYQTGMTPPGGDYRSCRLEPGGALQCFTLVGNSNSGVNRFTLSAPPELIYDDSGKTVKIFQSALMTGP
jgi:hypothetical protein